MNKFELKKIIKEEIEIILKESNPTLYQNFANQFVEILQPRIIQYYKDSTDELNKDYPDRSVKYDVNVHKGNWEIKVKPGMKWVRIDVGSSGKFMLNTEDGNLYFIKGYGTPDLKKNFGNIEGIINNKDNWWYDGYSISPKGVKSKFGYAGRIDGVDVKSENKLIESSYKEDFVFFEKLANKQTQIYPDAADAGITPQDRDYDTIRPKLVDITKKYGSKNEKHQYGTTTGGTVKIFIPVEWSDEYTGEYRDDQRKISGYLLEVSFYKDPKLRKLYRRDFDSFFTIDIERIEITEDDARKKYNAKL